MATQSERDTESFGDQSAGGFGQVVAALLMWGCFIFVFLKYGALLIGMEWYGWDSAKAYALWYDVPVSRVAADKKPHDCDWGAAPLGNKNCHYEANVRAILVKLDGAGMPYLVSYRRGRANGRRAPGSGRR
jgi:hypothetical protein